MATFYLGQIITFAGNFAIRGTAMCNGQILSITQNTALFSLLGTTYGGNGTNNFALPNLQGRRMNHVGQGIGLSDYTLGQQGGVENVTLTTTTMAQHTHAVSGSVNASTTTASSLVPGAGAVLGATTDLSAKGAQPAIYCPAGTSATIALGGLNAAAVGSGAQFSVINPYLAITMLILLQGIFPSRN